MYSYIFLLNVSFIIIDILCKINVCEVTKKIMLSKYYASRNFAIYFAINISEGLIDVTSLTDIF